MKLLSFLSVVFCVLAAAQDAVIVVEKKYFPSAKACFENLKNTSCSVKVALANGALHYDHARPYILKISGDRQVSIHANEYSYHARWTGPASSSKEMKADFEKAMKHIESDPSLAPTLTVYKNVSEDIASLSPGTVLEESPSYREITLGRAIGALRKMAVRSEDCAKTFVGNHCTVKLLPSTDPDHPGPPFAEIPSTAEYTFEDGSRVEATTDDDYHSYEVRYIGGAGESKEEKLSKISRAIEALKAEKPDLYLTAHVFTPLNLAKLASEPYSSGAIVEENLGFAAYAAIKTWDLDLKACLSQFDESTLSCSVSHEAHFPSHPKVLFEHTDDYETREILFEGKGLVAMNVGYDDGYTIEFIPSHKQVGTDVAKKAIENAFKELSSSGKLDLSVRMMKVFE